MSIFHLGIDAQGLVQNSHWIVTREEAVGRGGKTISTSADCRNMSDKGSKGVLYVCWTEAGDFG